MRTAPLNCTVHLRSDAFAKAAELAGFSSNYALAKKTRLNRSTVVRVRRGLLLPGPVFTGGALKALAPMQ